MVDEKDEDMDLFFDAARAAAPQPSADLMARIMADAEAQQPVAVPLAPRQHPGIIRGFLAAIGGWPAMAGMMTATVAGLWIGVNPPTGLEDIASTFLGSKTTEYLSDYMPTFAGLDIGG